MQAHTVCSYVQNISYAHVNDILYTNNDNYMRKSVCGYHKTAVHILSCQWFGHLVYIVY